MKSMKKRLCILFILMLVLTASAVGYLQWGPVPAWLLTGITVSSAESGQPEYHSLTTEEARLLASSLNEAEVAAGNVFNDKIHHEADLAVTLHFSAPLQRQYSLNVSPSNQLLFQRRGRETAMLSLNPSFFIHHPAFIPTLFPHAQPPKLKITGADDPYLPQLTVESWSYQLWDEQWVESALPATNPENESQLLLFKTDTPLFLNVDHAPDVIRLKVTDPAGTLRYDDVLETYEIPLFPYNGRHEYALTLDWEGNHQPYRGTVSTQFTLDMDLPLVFEPPGPRAVQGEMITFRARHVPDGAEVVLEQNLTGGNATLYPLEDGYVAYFPTHYGNQPGAYQINYGLAGEALTTSTLTLLPRDFHIQYLTVDAGVAAATWNEEAYAMTARYFTPSRNESAEERYYTEGFVIPVRGRLTTEFGETRYVNNAPTSYRHSGLDIAAPTGTPIVAVNRGRIVLAMNLITQGNTVVIDHGQGLFSVYFHMDELHTTADTIVERGETIGTVGTTGFSTGPHLHFTMSYHRHNLEPGHFLVGEPITYQNAAQYLAP